MKNFGMAGLASLCMLLPCVGAHAITFGQADGNQHPAVGALVDYDSHGTPYAFCTGAMISPTVMLTAAHCDPGVPQVAVTFADRVHAGAAMMVGRYIPHPHYDRR